MDGAFTDRQSRRIAPAAAIGAMRVTAAPLSHARAPVSRSRDGGSRRAGAALRDLLADRGVPQMEKRAMLASWASDACAVENMPSWRRIPETGALVPVDEILGALQALDRGAFN